MTNKLLPEPPEVPNPFAFDNVAAYSAANRTFNMYLQEVAGAYLSQERITDFVRKRIAEALQLPPEECIDVTIATVGSDARMEKCPPSSYEVIAYIRRPNNGLSEHVKNDLREEIGEIVDSEAVMRSLGRGSDDMLVQKLFCEVEVKTLSSPDFLFYHGDRTKGEWPSRILDARALGPDDGDLVRAGKDRLLLENAQKDAHKHFLSLESHRHRNARQVVHRNGTDKFRKKAIRHYDLECGMLSFNPDTGANAFKHGPLRAVQTLITWKLLQSLHARSAEDAQQLAHGIPAAVTEKLRYLLSMNVLDARLQKPAEELPALYDACLFWHHRAAYAFHADNKTTHIVLARDDAADVREMLAVLDDRMRRIAEKPGR